MKLLILSILFLMIAVARRLADKPKQLKEISYEKFMAMNLELGEKPSDEESVFAILKTFYKNDSRDWRICLNEFYFLLRKDCKTPDLNLDFENKPAEYFLIADTYVSKSNLVALYNHLSGKNEKDISVSLATKTKNEFLLSVAHFKDLYEWIYNPPAVGKIGEWSTGKQMRTDFARDYGAYAEITYLIATTESISFKKAEEKPLSEYLAVGEYLLRKRICESVI